MSERKPSGPANHDAGKSVPVDTKASGTARAKRVSASGARRGKLGRALDHVSANPLTVVAGAVAVSAGLAFLLPSTDRESEVMGEVAEKLGEVARDAADSVVAAGRAEVEGLAQTALAGVGGAVLQAVTANGDTSTG